jgi:hypothetical protein
MKELSRPLLNVALVHGMLGWIYIAAWAAVRPEGLSGQLSHWLPLRRDTFGVLCFTASALAYFILEFSPRPWWSRGTCRHGPIGAGLRTLVWYPLLAWAYLCVNSLTHPWTIDQPLTHFATVPSESTTAVACFAISAGALLALRMSALRTSKGGSYE